MKSEPNQPAAGNAGIAPRLTIEHHFPGVPEPERYVAGEPRQRSMMKRILLISMAGLLAAGAFWLGRTTKQGTPDKGAGSSFQSIDITESESDREDGTDGWHGWHRSWQESLEAARVSQKPIFILFTGSEWCYPCQTLERNVIASAEFQKWATDFELCVYVYPKSDERGDDFDSIQDLQGDLVGDHGVPNWAFCRSDGTVIRTGGGYSETQSAADWIQAEDICDRSATSRDVGLE